MTPELHRQRQKGWY